MNQERMQQFMWLVRQLWLEPELHRRYPSGSVPPGFQLRAVQIVFDANNPTDPEIRLNDEVRAAGTAHARAKITRDEPIDFADDALVDVVLTDGDPNAAHITAFATGGGWLVAFDLRLNAARMAEHGRAAREFLDSAAQALERGAMRPFVENLLGGTELMAKALLLKGSDSHRLLRTRTHKAVTTTFNQKRREGKVDVRFVDLLNRLWELRASARYLDGRLDLNAREASTMLAVAHEMYNALVEATPPRVSLAR